MLSKRILFPEINDVLLYPRLMLYNVQCVPIVVFALIYASSCLTLVFWEINIRANFVHVQSFCVLILNQCFVYVLVACMYCVWGKVWFLPFYTWSNDNSFILASILNYVSLLAFHFLLQKKGFQWWRSSYLSWFRITIRLKQATISLSENSWKRSTLNNFVRMSTTMLNKRITGVVFPSSYMNDFVAKGKVVFFHLLKHWSHSPFSLKILYWTQYEPNYPGLV